MIKKIILFLLLSVSLFPQAVCTAADSSVFNELIGLANRKHLEHLQIEKVISEIGLYLIGTDYEAGTIEPAGDEELVVHLTGLDCYTFVEACLAAARCIASRKTTFDDFTAELENIRYRNGIIDGYPSRLHYFSDWIYNLTGRNILRDETEKLGGKPYEKKINFMSGNADKYPRLKDGGSNLDRIIEIENKINKRKLYYIPENAIESIENNIPSGAIIGITTEIKGLDISHTGIALKKSNGKIYLLHAPNVGQKVQVSKLPLDEYLKKNKLQTGIIVAFPVEPQINE